MPNATTCLDCGQRRGHKRGLCGTCYMRRRRSGVDMPPKRLLSFEEHLAKVVPSENGCWPWLGSLNENGYGQAGAHRKAHVLSYEHHIGSVPDGHDVGHLCHDRDDDCAGGAACLHRRCINPEHLAPQTRSVNLFARKPQRLCKRNHDLSPENVYVIKATGSRQCRLCRTEMSAERNARRRANRAKKRAELRS